MIYHIYWGTSGNAGLYLDEIYQCLKTNGFEQRVFVNYYYPFSYGDKVFFKYSDIANGSLVGTQRKIVQLLEALKGYTLVLYNVCKYKPSVVNYSHAGKSFFFVYWFIKILKLFSDAKVVITCHDVMPLDPMPQEMRYRRKIFNLADFLLVHNSNSITVLEDKFNIDKKKIIKHLFPVMDLSKLTSKKNERVKDIDFLFIGNVSKGKGIELLLSAWREFYSKNKTAKLFVCGRKLPGVNLSENELNKCNVVYDLNFISDSKYFDYVSRARFVLLPYIQGTNSGIISTVLSLGASVITSDLPMFVENPLVASDCIFKANNKEALVEILLKKTTENNSDTTSLDSYRKRFDMEVVHVYNQLLMLK